MQAENSSKANETTPTASPATLNGSMLSLRLIVEQDPSCSFLSAFFGGVDRLGAAQLRGS